MATVKLHKTKRPTKKRPSRQVWMLRWYGTDGKRYGEIIGEVGELPKREAERLRRKRQGDMDHHVAPVNKPKPVTLAEFFEDDRAIIEMNVTAGTIADYDGAVKHAVAAIGGETKLANVTGRHVAAVKKYLKDRSKATRDKVVRTLRAAFYRAMRRDKLIHSNPFGGEKVNKVQPKAKRIFRIHEIEAMVAVAPSVWWEAFIELLVSTGLRKNEALHLTWMDVNLTAGTVTVTRKDAGTVTVGGESLPVFPFEAKDHDERVVSTMTDDATLALKRLKAASGGSPYVFVSVDRLRQLAVRGTPVRCIVPNPLPAFHQIQRAAQALLARETGEPVEWPIGSLHDLRKTYGTHTAQDVPMTTIQRWMGHSDIKTTAQYYVGVCDDDARRSRSAWNRRRADTRQTLEVAATG